MCWEKTQLGHGSQKWNFQSESSEKTALRPESSLRRWMGASSKIDGRVGERGRSLWLGGGRGHSKEMWNNTMPANKCTRKARGRKWGKMSLERKVGKVGTQAKKFGLYFRTGVGWKDWKWLPSLGPIPRGSRNFCDKTHKATKCKGNVGKAHT